YLPDKRVYYPDDATAVNVFRRLLNAYFEAKLPVLAPKHFFSSYQKPYAFSTVPNPNETLGTDGAMGTAVGRN
ncbi:MAG: hypothetical protein KDD44_12165, partial [Bdellovibrionales bacterium]|nr:hypothetical protein [Bdellovibrionales bacterium]